MMGLPTETVEDIEGIAHLAEKVVDLLRQPTKPKGQGHQVTMSVSCFVPKPFTPFPVVDRRNHPAASKRSSRTAPCGAVLKIKHVSFRLHKRASSVLEADFGRGDRRLCAVV